MIKAHAFNIAKGIGIYTTFLHYKYNGLQADLAPLYV